MVQLQHFPARVGCAVPGRVLSSAQDLPLRLGEKENVFVPCTGERREEMEQ